jgi:hypothetical protein
MPAFSVLPFPSAVVGDRVLTLTNDFAEGPIAATFAFDGRLHVLSEIFYNADRYREPAANDLSGHYMTRFGVDLSGAHLTSLAELTAAKDEIGGYDSICDFAVVDDGWLVMTNAGHSWLLSTTGKLIRAFAVDAWDDKPKMYAANFAGYADVRPDGRLVVAIAEAGSAMTPNVVAVSIEPRPTFNCGQPTLRYLNSFYELDREGDAPELTLPYVQLPSKKPFTDRTRPKPVLVDALGDAGCSIRGLCAVTDEVTLIASYVDRCTKRSAFQLALIDDRGRLITTLDLRGDTPYAGAHLAVAAAHKCGWAIIKTESQVHVFDAGGRAVTRIALGNAALKPLAGLHLLAATPDGGLLLCHRAHRTLLLVDPADPTRLPDALAAAAAHYKMAWGAAKKLYNPVNAHWVV